MLNIVTNISMLMQLSLLTILLFLLLVIKLFCNGFKKPNNKDFFHSIIICVSFYSCWAILKVVTMVQESNDIVVPIFLALAMQIWMTINSITDFWSSRDDE
ncbi:TPA: hypothetical protein I7777_05920 [Vibrio vulnificus]|nr:hypothetical protein [Vibrio vulnificus]